jgi:hypothetical protein
VILAKKLRNARTRDDATVLLGIVTTRNEHVAIRGFTRKVQSLAWFDEEHKTSLLVRRPEPAAKERSQQATRLLTKFAALIGRRSGGLLCAPGRFPILLDDFC